MLKSLHIENYALIRQSDIDFGHGFVAITGETGAGKSIMLGALGLLLGQKSDAKTLHDPERKCVVEALLDISRLDLRPLFDDNDVDYADDGQLIIRREVLPSAKSRAFVNDTPVGVSFLRQLGNAIIDIHSQHATLLLGDSNFQTSLIDSIAANGDLLADYRSEYKCYSQLKRQLEQLTNEEQQNRRDYDYNKFLYDELASADLREGEQEELEEESTLLANAEGIKQSLSQMIELCDGEGDSALSRLNACKSLIAKLSPINPQFQSLHERIDSTLIELRDIESTIEEINDNTTFSPQRQEEVDERLSLIYKLQKKHGADSVQALLRLQEELDRKLQDIDSSEERIHEVMEQVDASYKRLQKLGEQLTENRQKGARQLEQDIAPLFADLGMAGATLKADVGSSTEYSATGCNHITLLFNANKGGELRELSKVASGGEMSRLMLAIKSLTARSGLLPTIILDEIDTGISGDISVKVGRIMRRMADTMQVIAITHLPQIAARADSHYKVYKDDSQGVTASNIRMLSHDERIHEIASMLSSEPPSEAALQTAKELMES